MLKWMLMLAVVSFSVPSFGEEDPAKVTAYPSTGPSAEQTDHTYDQTSAEIRQLMQEIQATSGQIKSGTCDLRKDK